MPYLQFHQKHFVWHFDLIKCSRICLLWYLPSWPIWKLRKRRSKLTKRQNAVSETKFKMIQNAVAATLMHFVSCYDESNTFCTVMVWNVIFSCILWEHLSLQAINTEEKNKMPNMGWNSINIRTKSWNCTEISLYWRLAQYMKNGMHSCHIL